MRIGRFAFVIAVLSLAAGPGHAADHGADGVDRFAEARTTMVRIIQLQIELTKGETGVAHLDPSVIDALKKVPRHAFVPEPLVALAYIDRPLPLGYGQNISQPFIVALMTQLLALEPTDVVLETGTGAGYQAAVLAELVAEVYSVVVVGPLALEASARLRALDYDNVHTLTDDGYYGWRRKGPYDAILLKEAVDHVPPPLLAQLKPGGRIVLPLGPLNGPQVLTIVEKGDNGTLREARVLDVQFAPLQGGDRI